MSDAEITYDLTLLEQSAATWARSPGLRAVYGDIFAQMKTGMVPGTALELGSGIGLAKEFLPELVTSDVIATPYVDRAVSAYALGEAGESWDNILAFDVLHHLREPMTFFRSAGAALRPGGRLILTEPAATRFGRLFYRTFHHEPCEPALITPPFAFVTDAQGEFANMGMAWALWGKHRAALDAVLGESDCVVRSGHFRDVLAYPATGGFSRRTLLPTAVLRGLLRMEKCLPQFVLRQLGLRVVIVVERKRP